MRAPSIPLLATLIALGAMLFVQTLAPGQVRAGMSDYTLRFEPPTDEPVDGYLLSITRDAGVYAASGDTDIPVAALGDPAADGSLSYTFQLDDSADHFLSLRAYNAAGTSTRSNELLVPAAAAPQPMGVTDLLGVSETGSTRSYIFVQAQATPDTGSVRFELDGHTIRVDHKSPFSFFGDLGEGKIIPFDTMLLADGPHSITASGFGSDGEQGLAMAVQFTVDNAAARAAALAEFYSKRKHPAPVFVDQNAPAASESASESGTEGGEADDTPAAIAPDGDSGAAPIASISLDGAGEYLAERDARTLGFGSEFSISMWVRPDDPSALSQLLEIIPATGNANRITVLSPGNTSGDPIRFLTMNSAGQWLQYRDYADVQRPGEWLHIVITQRGSSNTVMEGYFNGAFVPPTKVFHDRDGAMSDGARQVFIGAADRGGRDFFSGAVGHVAIFDRVLTPGEIAEIHAGGHDFDLGVVQGAYGASGDLLHYWRPGEDLASLGRDFAGDVHLDDSFGVGTENAIEDAP